MKWCALLTVLLVSLLAQPAAGAAQRSQATAALEAEGQAPQLRPPVRPDDQSSRSSADAPALPEYRFGAPAQDRSLLWDGARMALSLAVVLAVLGVGVKLVRRWPGFASAQTGAGPLQIMGRLPLTAKEAICLVRAGGEVLVVGVSPGRVSLLHRLEGGIADGLRSSSLAAVPQASRWGDAPSGRRLRELLGRIREVQTAWGIGPTEPRSER